ncbi:MAG: outer membrane beta-barrel protein [Gammaproteobacteria bacterium]|nr:outer membrane beta-barrel protein [Gammaproteobacteria bacterium]
MKRLVHYWMTASAALLSLPALAAEDWQPRLEVTPFAAYKFGGEFNDSGNSDSYSLDASPAFGLVVGVPWTAESTLEVYYSRQSTEVDIAGFQSSGAPVDLDLDFLHIGGTYYIDRERAAMPYFVATAGGTRISPQGPGTRADTFFSFGVGGGWSFYPRERIGLRLEGRALGTLVDSDSRLFCGVNNGAGGCLIQTSGDVLWQFEVQAGVVFRF